jgi:predicted PurR-regulated permease PerM
VDIHRISPWAALRVTGIVFGVLIVLRFLWIAHAIFVVTFLGMLLGLAMARGVDFLERLRIPRGAGAALVLLVFVGVMVGLFAMIGPSITEQSRELGKELPKALQQIEQWISRTPAKALVQQQTQQQTPQQQQQQPQNGGGLTDQLGKELRGATKFLFPIVSSIFGAIGGVVIVLFIAMYIAAAPGLYREGMLHLVPHRHRARAAEWLSTLRDTLRQWLVARLIAMVVIGVITGGALALLKVKGAVALGVLAGLLEFVPFFGPIVSAIPAIGIALVDSPQKALYVIVLYLVIQQIEGNVVTPLLLEKRLDIPPVMTVVAVAALGVVFGVIGMLIAEPLLAVILVTTKMLYVTDVVGDEVKIGKEESSS